MKYENFNGQQTQLFRFFHIGVKHWSLYPLINYNYNYNYSITISITRYSRL